MTAEKTPTNPHRTDPELSPGEELHVALATLSSFQSATSQADGKVGTIVVAHAGLTALMATQIGEIRPVLGSAAFPVLVPLVATLATFLVALAICWWYLIQAIRPRTVPLPGANRFSFPSRPRPDAPAAATGAREQCAQVWEVVGVLAEIAVAKHRYVAAAIGWSAVMLISAVGWLAIAALA
ncbi:hypothetical protein [Rhizohabitans arisaemae]|uniref:hypothetical protein n=1 Tax=Rhizohabitans arisaemae TaxID=2720610 RepID=UPI0024B1775C|nr:hypothetical protein [Rhizohabitans arisaemae]